MNVKRKTKDKQEKSKMVDFEVKWVRGRRRLTFQTISAIVSQTLCFREETESEVADPDN